MTNRYLEDSFAPLGEEYTLTDLEVSGQLPDYLDGRYLRNGPNPIGELDPEHYHWFIGDGMVHGLRIRDGKADNTNVIGHAGRTLALVEGGVANYELTDELDTLGTCDFDGTITGGYTAHPKRDPDTGELHAVSYSMYRGDTVQYSVIGTDGRARRTVDVQVTGSPMMHDFSLTERHVVFYDLPVTFDARQAAELAAPRGLRLPARLMLSALIGRVRIPDQRQNAVWNGFGPPIPVFVESALPRPRRRHAPRGRQRRRALVRRRTVLRLPSDECLR